LISSNPQVSTSSTVSAITIVGVQQCTVRGTMYCSASEHVYIANGLHQAALVRGWVVKLRLLVASVSYDGVSSLPAISMSQGRS